MRLVDDKTSANIADEKKASPEKGVIKRDREERQYFRKVRRNITGEQIDFRPAPLTVLDGLKVIGIIVVIVLPIVSVFAEIIKLRLRNVPDFGLVLGTEDDRGRGRRRQPRGPGSLKTPLEIPRQKGLNSVAVGQA